MDIADIRLWNIYFIPDCRYTNPQKDKLAVAAVIDGSSVYAFLINSRLRPFIQKQPDLLSCEAIILEAEHDTVLRHDSFIDCTELFEFQASEFDSGRGQISENALIALFNAVQDCKVLPRKDKRLIREAARKYLASQNPTQPE